MMKMRNGLLSLSIGAVTLAAACTDTKTHSQQSSPATSAGRFIVKYKDRGAALAAVTAVGGSVARDLAAHDAVAVHLPAQAAAALAANPAVDFVEEDPVRAPTAQATPYGISMVQATDPAFATDSGTNVKVCIIDSGLYTEHEDLAGLAVTGEAGTAWNADGCGHGTHVAGTVAAANNSLGVVGVAPAAVSLHIVRVFGDDCSWSYASDLIAALDECRAAGARVVSMSLGGSFASNAEDQAFQNAWDAGVLSIAAAGNGGSTRKSYPASYASVISVAAIDASETVADFSQKNDAVDLAAPGVGVLSTVPWTTPTVTVDGATYMAGHIEGAATGTASGALVDGGLCNSTSTAWSGKVVLCERGEISFFDKVMNVQNSGGVAALIYNNVSGGFAGTLGDNSSTILALGLSQEDGQALVANKLGVTADVADTMDQPGNGYEAWDGTSMATPHVSGVAALIWSFHPARTNAEVRTALESTAKDLGSAGYDTSYGNGLVQAKHALDYLAGGATCTVTESPEASCSDGADNDCDGAADGADGDCAPTCTVTESPETSCGDGLDNDCDGTVDSNDGDCVSCTPLGATCSSNAECCTGKCKGKPGAKTCK